MVQILHYYTISGYMKIVSLTFYAFYNLLLL